MSATLAFYLSRSGRRATPVTQVPVAVGDSRDILAGETTVIVNVLANDTHVAGAVVTIQGAVIGADAAVVGSVIHVTRIGTAAGSYSLTYRATTAQGFSEAILSGTIEAALVAPTAVDDTRNLTSVEISAAVDVLANDTNVAGAVVTIAGDDAWSDGTLWGDGTTWSDLTSVTGATAEVAADGQTIEVTRIGTGSGSYSLTYQATTDGGSDEATLSGSIAVYQEVGIPALAGTTDSPGGAVNTFGGTTVTPGSTLPVLAGTS